jgi:hypothetical protein
VVLVERRDGIVQQARMVQQLAAAVAGDGVQVSVLHAAPPAAL